MFPGVRAPVPSRGKVASSRTARTPGSLRPRRTPAALGSVVFALAWLAHETSAGAQVPAVERAALIDFYHATGGPGWARRDGWLGPAGTECTWFGVGCIGGTRVRFLALSANGLTGSLPASLRDLSQLLQLIVFENTLSGEIPTALADLAQLESLALQDNDFSGTLPASLRQVASLRSLLASNNQLAGPLPDWISELSALEHLSLGGNRFEGPLPASWAALDALRSLDVAGNRLTGELPEWLGDLTQLGTLDLGGNRLVGEIPAALGRLAGLVRLGLGRNALEGTLPDELGALSGLLFLELHANRLAGPFPPWIPNLSDLFMLRLDGNSFSGPLPPELGQLDRLQFLFLTSNRFSGRIPPELGGMAALERLGLESNQLTGPLPSELQALTGARHIGFSFNGVSAEGELLAFLEARLAGLGSSQTVAPTSVRARAVGADSILVDWQPIAFTANAGGYRVEIGSSAAGPFTAVGTTADKTVRSLVVSGLSPGTGYAFRVSTFTLPHDLNPGTVVSEPSAPVLGSTSLAGAGTLEPAVGAVRLAEGETRTVDIRRIGGNAGRVTVTYEVQIAADFSGPTRGTLVWPAGDSTSRSIVLTAHTGAATTPGKTAFLTLSAPTGGASLGTPAAISISLLAGAIETGRVSEVASAGAEAAIASDALGAHVVVWTQAQSGGTSILGRRFAPDGKPAGPPVEVSTGGALPNQPDVATTHDGGFVVVWQEATTGQILGRRFHPDGTPDGNPQLLSEGSGPFDAPAIAVGPDGDLLVVWRASGAGTGGEATAATSSILGRRFDPGALPLGPIEELHRSDEELSPPDVAVAASGEALAVWHEGDGVGSDRQVRGLRLDAMGRAAGEAFDAHVDPRGPQSDPSVAAAGDGFLLVWQGPTDTAGGEPALGSRVYARNFGPSGEAGEPERAIGTGDGSDSQPSATGGDGQSCTVAWRRRTGAQTSIVARQFVGCASGAASAETVLETAPDLDGQSPNVSAAPGGAAALAFSLLEKNAAAGGVAAASLATAASGPCQSGPRDLCLESARFRATLVWRSPEGAAASASAVALTANTGYFWFFDQDNVEAVVKVLDGCGLNDRFWVFAGGLTDVEASLVVTDSVTGHTRLYANPAGTAFAPVRDTDAFATCAESGRSPFLPSAASDPPQTSGAGGASRHAAPVAGACATAGATLCVQQDRFAVTLTYDTGTARGDGQAVQLTGDTGYHWFFDADNVEVVVKVLDGCALNGRFWVFAGGLTDVGVRLTVTDTATGQERIYVNELGRAFQPLTDTGAFATCP
jgi:Leucine-rich repeat (LRR) protein